MAWQLVHTTSLAECGERRMFDFVKSLAWQARQASSTCFAGWPSMRLMVVLSNGFLGCFSPGPWQDSQPKVFSTGWRETMILKWGFLGKSCQTSGWQVWQTASLKWPGPPTFWAASDAGAS